MKITKLTMKAFGKFNNKTIALEPGLNLIQGNNEAGKTTAQAFIQGMYFGFYKPYRKKKTYASEYEKYLPWELFDYSGSLIYEVDGREIRLERNFLRGKDSLTIYDNATGENITDSFKYDSVIRQHLPLAELEMTPGIYNNTVNIRQLPVELEPGPQEEIRECYLKMLKSDGTDMNLKGIVRRLEEKKKNIGRSGQSKSKVGLAIRKRDELLLALKEGDEAYLKVAANQELIVLYQKRMEKIESENDSLYQKTEVNHKRELLQNYEKISELEKENARISKEIKGWEELECFSYEKLEGLKALQNQIERLSDQMNYIEKEMNDLESHLKTIRKKEESKRGYLNGNTWEDITEDYETIKENIQLPEDTKKKSKKGIGFLLAALIICGIGLAGSMMNGTLSLSQSLENVLLTLGIAMTLVGVIGAVFVAVIITGNRKDRLDQSDSWIQLSILEKYHVNTPEEFNNYFNKASRIQKELEQMKNEGELLTVQQSRRQAGFEVLFEQRRGIIKELCVQLSKVGVKSVKEYAEGCQKSQHLEELKIRFNTNLQLLKGLYETVNAKKDAAGKPLWENAAPQAEELLRLGKEIARLEGENNSLMEGVSLPVETSESLKTLNAQIDTCDLEIRACDAALEILEKIQKETHQESAPELNQRIGTILGDITQHYEGVKIDETMKVKVVDPLVGDFRDAEQLSAGTMDQVHFAFRYGISDVLDRDMPFILDEPFARYDNERKTQALKLLAGLSQRQQVILFTCGQDEGKILDDLGVDYHTIQL
ncbi:ATP-binding protein [Acetobacterium sp.]|uniref:ATP-binding protein n=1 Tax=Acetobacterium sp. TaxID=1872094 RepID=UPI002F42D8E1